MTLCLDFNPEESHWVCHMSRVYSKQKTTVLLISELIVEYMLKILKRKVLVYT